MKHYLLHTLLAAVWCAEVFALAYGTDFRGEIYKAILGTAAFGLVPGLAGASLIKRTGYWGSIALLALANLGVGIYVVHHQSEESADIRREMASEVHRVGFGREQERADFLAGSQIAERAAAAKFGQRFGNVMIAAGAILTVAVLICVVVLWRRRSWIGVSSSIAIGPQSS